LTTESQAWPYMVHVCCLCCRANTTSGKPRAGSNVTIPFGWNLVIDESPPPLYMLVIEVCVSALT
jgi:hypothetical protein